jgi:predicted Zn-dependent protease
MKSGLRRVVAGMLCAVAMSVTYSRAESDIEVRVMPHDLAVSAHELEQWLGDQNLVVPDSALLRYIDSIKTHIVVANNIAAGTYSIRLLRSTEPNAHSFVNGSIYICTAVLGMMTDEAHLAMLLAHEIAHISLGHHVGARYELHRKSRELARQQMAASVFIGSLAAAGGSQSLRRAMCGFSRDQEAEADKEAVAMVVKAGYSGAAAINFFTILDQRLQNEKSAVQDPEYATHPELVDRLEACRASLIELGQDTVVSHTDSTVYHARIRNLLVDNARDFCREGKYSFALSSLEDIGMNSLQSPRMLFERAAIFARRDTAADLDSCVRLYNQALTMQPDLYDAERELGYSFYKLGKTGSAGEWLNRYLDHCPGAADTGFVRLYLRSCL